MELCIRNSQVKGEIVQEASNNDTSSVVVVAIDAESVMTSSSTLPTAAEAATTTPTTIETTGAACVARQQRLHSLHPPLPPPPPPHYPHPNTKRRHSHPDRQLPLPKQQKTENDSVVDVSNSLSSSFDVDSALSRVSSSWRDRIPWLERQHDMLAADCYNSMDDSNDCNSNKNKPINKKDKVKQNSALKIDRSTCSWIHGFNETIHDFDESEWTPQDSSYGAAIPIGGWIPKPIRRMIEWSLILIGTAVFMYLVVTTSMRVMDKTRHGGGSSNSSAAVVDSTAGGNNNAHEDSYYSYYSYGENYGGVDLDDDLYIEIDDYQQQQGDDEAEEDEVESENNGD